MQVQDRKVKNRDCENVFPNEIKYFVFYLWEFFGTVWDKPANISDDKVRLAEVWGGYHWSDKSNDGDIKISNYIGDIAL